MWSILPLPILVWVTLYSGILSLCQAQDGDQKLQIADLKEDLTDEFSTTPLPPPPEFLVYDRAQMPCVLVMLDATLLIEPKRTNGKSIAINVPKSAEATGSCGTGEDSKIVLSWRSFRFLWHFQKSRVSDAWYVDQIELTYNTTDRAFGNVTQDIPGMVQVIRSPPYLTLFLTPIGRAYGCNFAKDVKIFDDKRFARVTIKINRIKVQPFAAMTQRQYGDEFKCQEEAGRGNEAVPFAIGGLLALAVLGTIGGYGGYRYFKVKKIEYDTMDEYSNLN